VKHAKGIRAKRSNERLNIPLLAPLFDDLVECEELIDRGDTQFSRRTYVRASFAFTEAFVFWLRGIVAQKLSASVGSLDSIMAAKIILLSEQSHFPDRNGKLESRENRVPWQNSVAFAIRTMAECIGADAESIFGDSGWGEFKKALSVRHRITHPRDASQMDITDDDLDAVRESHRWLMNALIDIMSPQSPVDS
jgi:hypothetical protein